ncbi:MULTISPECIES: hypothetical protein [Streptococcus]|nr:MULTISPECIES: hypothetical protein [Streptococcus]MCB2843671.1 hypothetical protein [Streptococcus dysgalactiae subsp. dysgalactiae]MEE3743288.1 hypothetical protein [Streptococcus dysgalactiae]OCX08412.1 hypothetical protein GCS_04430 [Streptococcus dysgalactiae subsp. equisimilis AKSDE4288]QJD62353.1 hypothetical protein HG697_07715 [Streptococcus dysgalactiae subsp. equisimilis]QJD64295.1 hypothetical protein HHM65_07945 [Streptococcus dysgalactiae subsp. equisimilis]
MLNNLFIEKKGIMMSRKGVQEYDVTNVSERSIKIIKKAMYDEGTGFKPIHFYGIAICEGTREFYRPTYPFVRSEEDLDSLKDFINLYETDLLTFYTHGHNYDFGCFIYGIGNDGKDKFRDRWFKEGVIFY